MCYVILIYIKNKIYTILSSDWIIFDFWIESEFWLIVDYNKNMNNNSDLNEEKKLYQIDVFCEIKSFSYRLGVK